MQSEGFMSFVKTTMEWIAGFFVVAIILLLLTIIVFYIIDSTQKKHAIRHNFPVIGRFRYWFEHLGEFFRQYFFSMDREELPLIALSAPGFIEQRKISVAHRLLVPPAISTR